MLPAFTVGFKKVLKSCLLLHVALPDLIDTLCTVASLKILAMIAYDVAKKGTWHRRSLFGGRKSRHKIKQTVLEKKSQLFFFFLVPFCRSLVSKQNIQLS